MLEPAAPQVLLELSHHESRQPTGLFRGGLSHACRGQLVARRSPTACTTLAAASYPPAPDR
jgi:hypothetical protein